ncbi:hypothetical protein A8H28_16195 [Burkholderia gladioli pv. gladioli]|nr:hypothetical protein A8H28_16195 [Burkholderia gladioli pv. gladioli]
MSGAPPRRVDAQSPAIPLEQGGGTGRCRACSMSHAVGRSVNRSVNRSISRSVSRSISRSISGSTGRLSRPPLLPPGRPR